MKLTEVCIYSLTDPLSKEVFWIGKTCDPEARLRTHLQCDARANPAKNERIKALKEKKLEPVMKILETCSIENWAERERHWIHEMLSRAEPLCNVDLFPTQKGEALTTRTDLAIAEQRLRRECAGTETFLQLFTWRPYVHYLPDSGWEITAGHTLISPKFYWNLGDEDGLKRAAKQLSAFADIICEYANCLSGSWQIPDAMQDLWMLLGAEIFDDFDLDESKKF